MYDRVICTEIGTKKKFQNRIRPQATLVNICPVPYYEIMLAALFSRGRVPITGFLRFFRSATTAVICCGTITVTLYLSSCTTAMLPRFLSTEHQKHSTKILSNLLCHFWQYTYKQKCQTVEISIHFALGMYNYITWAFVSTRHWSTLFVTCKSRVTTLYTHTQF